MEGLTERNVSQFKANLVECMPETFILHSSTKFNIIHSIKKVYIPTYIYNDAVLMLAILKSSS